MGPSDIFLKRAVLGLSVILVLLLSGAAVYNLFSNDQPPVSTGVTVNEEPAAPTRPYRGERIEIGDSQFPLTIGCIRDRTADDVFLVVIENRGETTTDYVISASLTTDDGASVDAMAMATELRPGEEREVALIPEGGITNPSDCTIKVVQGDRRVLLNSR